MHSGYLSDALDEGAGPRSDVMRLEMRDLRLAVAMGEFKTLTQAAQHLNLTPSALSHQLADLERRLGALLFERSGRRLIATHLGELLCANGRTALTGVED